MISPRLVGRERELRLLVTTVARPPAVVVIEGESGVGKTRLVAELWAGTTETTGHRHTMGACRRIREPFPLGPVLEAVRGLAEDLRTAELSPVAGTLRPLLPEIAHVLPPQPDPLDDRDAERHRVFRGLLEVLGSVGPTVLVLEDLHWADQQTLDFLAYLLGDPPPDLSLVVTFRRDEAAPGVPAMVARLPAEVRSVDIALEPLDEACTGVMAAAILGADRVSEEFAAYLWERTSGLPLAIEEILALLRARGSVARLGEQWARRALDELDVPTRISDSVLERVSRLSDGATAVVETAAVLQAHVPITVLVAASRGAQGELMRGIEEALASGLLTEHADVVGFGHLLAAQSVYEAIPGPRRRELHGRAAAALQSLDSVPLGQVAHHLRNAERLDEWVATAEHAADRAIELGHDEEATRLLEDVLRAGHLDADRRGRLAVKLGRAATHALCPIDDAVALLTELLDEDLRPQVHAELRFWLAQLLSRSEADPKQLRQLLIDAVDDLERPDLAVYAMVGLGVPMSADVPLEEHRKWLRRALTILPQVRDRGFEIRALGGIAMVLVTIGDPDWRRLTDRIVEQTGGTPSQRLEVSAYQAVGTAAAHVGKHEIADRLLSAASEGAATGDSRTLELRGRSAMILLDYSRGRWDGLRERADRLAGELTDSTQRCMVEAVDGCLALAHGDLGHARHRLTEIVAHLESSGGFDLLPLPAGALIRVALARGRLADAWTTSQRLIAAAESSETWVPLARAVPTVAQAMVAAGRLDRAGEMVADFARRVHGLDAALAPAALRHAGGFLDAGKQRRQSAARHYLAAAESYETLSCPYDAAQAREQAAVQLLAMADGHHEAAAALQAALATYQRLGATWDLDRAAGLARQHRLPAPSRYQGGRRGYGSALSPRERQVAELAASGLRNKEIADELFLSVRMVEKHMTAVLRKLRLRSRAGISRRLTEQGPAPPNITGGFPH